MWCSLFVTSALTQKDENIALLGKDSHWRLDKRINLIIKYYQYYKDSEYWTSGKDVFSSEVAVKCFENEIGSFIPRQKRNCFSEIVC